MVAKPAPSDEAAALIAKYARPRTCKVRDTGCAPLVEALRERGASFKLIATILTGEGKPITNNTVQLHVERRCACAR